MGSKKKDLEIIYNLQWNKSGNGGDKANIIGMYDIPTTTLNWEIFKSYLLKNSGTVGDDVKISYITDSNREFPIESQTDFQIALYAFRRKARMGTVVNLKLDTICHQQSQKNSCPNDVETQFDYIGNSNLSSCCNGDSPPEWFLIFMDNYMSEFKKRMIEELTASVTASVSASVSNIVSTIKPHVISQPTYHSRKSKAESSKRRKLPLLIADGSYELTKDCMKSLKLEGKLDHKLERLETKTKKLKEKKLALFSKSSDSDGGNVSVNRRSVIMSGNEDDILQMDAAPVNTQEMVPHMLGGEIYLHKWMVINTGKLPWNNDTTLMFTWGSKALKPLDSIVSVPHLKSGDTGNISVRLQIPSQPGQYECYFHFHHQSRRFGHWLGCQLIVDPFDLKGNKSVLETTLLGPFPHAQSGEIMSSPLYNIGNPVTRYGDIWQGTSVGANMFDNAFNLQTNPKEEATAVQDNNYELQSETWSVDKVVRDLSSRVDDLKLQDPTDTNCSSDSDNQSIISLPESSSSKGLPAEYVVVPIPKCIRKKIQEKAAGTQNEAAKLEAVEHGNFTGDLNETFDDNNNEDTNLQKENGNNDETSSNSSQKLDIVMVTLPDDDQDNREFACVLVDGQKIMIPKKIIKSEYLSSSINADRIVNENEQDSDVAGATVATGEEAVEIKKSFSQNNLETYSATNDRSGNLEENDFNSHCSAAGSSFSDVTAERNNRLFIFPQAYPGYEVVQGNDFTEDVYTWAKSETHYAQSCHGMKEPLIPVVSGNGTTEEPLIPVVSANGTTEEPLIPVVSANGTTEEPLIPVVSANGTTEEPLIPVVSANGTTKEPLIPVVSANGTTKEPLIPVVSANKTPEPLMAVNSNPFTDNITCVPNYQQTPIEERYVPFIQNDIKPEPFVIPSELDEEYLRRSTTTPPPRSNSTPQKDSPSAPVVHILPEGLVNGAVNVARSVINKIVPQGSPGNWVNGHWVSTNPDSPREANLHALAEMGFWNRDLNATLLARYNDDLSRVVAELVQ